MILPIFFFFQNTKISDIIHFKNLDDSVVIFQALQTSAASLTLVASATSLASTVSKAIFPQKTSWSWWFGHHRHHNDQYWSFFVEWIFKIQFFINIWYHLCFSFPICLYLFLIGDRNKTTFETFHLPFSLRLSASAKNVSVFQCYGRRLKKF